MSRTAALLVALALALVGLVACDDSSSEPTTTPSTGPAAAPPVRGCYLLAVADGLQLSNSAPRVPCTARHTSVTVAVGRIGKDARGTLVPLESAAAQRRIARTCTAKVDVYVGGTIETRRLSRVQAVWFSPTAEQLGTGARWFRCDLVVAKNQTAFANLPSRTRGLLDRPGARTRYGTCGTAAPGAAGFRRVTCAAAHTWKARATISLPSGASYLGRNAARHADERCRDVEARRAVRSTRLRWSFEWPTKAQWAAGQRYGLCWTPD